MFWVIESEHRKHFMNATVPNLHFLFSSLMTGRVSLTFSCLGCLELTLLPWKSLSFLSSCLRLLSSWYPRPMPTLIFRAAILSVWNVCAGRLLSSVILRCEQRAQDWESGDSTQRDVHLSGLRAWRWMISSLWPLASLLVKVDFNSERRQLRAPSSRTVWVVWVMRGAEEECGTGRAALI